LAGGLAAAGAGAVLYAISRRYRTDDAARAREPESPNP
jgi:hypothetical protein